MVRVRGWEPSTSGSADTLFPGVPETRDVAYGRGGGASIAGERWAQERSAR